MRSFATLFILLFALVATVSAQDTVQVFTGWNIIGSVKAGAVPDVLTTIPELLITSSFFGYAPSSGYQLSDTLRKGLGYWVKVSADGIIIFKGSSLAGCGLKRVDYGGVSYGTVQIGSQCWLEENLDVGTMVTHLIFQSDNATLEKYCYDDDSLNCGLYGGLYTWDEAMQYVSTEGAQGICPAGWHIPTKAEFQTLSNTVSGAGNALKGRGVGTGGGVGTNTSGFEALLGGDAESGSHSFLYIGRTSNTWSSTKIVFPAALRNYLLLYVDQAVVELELGALADMGFSVRCLAD